MKTEPGCSNNDYLTVDFTGVDQEKVCQVCGAIPAGNHFDVVSCRPCSAFYRRTVVLKRNYKCKLNGNCPINQNIRSLCPHCRFKKCLHLGMRDDNINVNYDKAYRKKVAYHLPTDVDSSKTPLLDEMIVGFRKFDDEAKKLFFVCNPEELFSGGNIEFKPGTVVESIIFNRSQLVYTWNMVIDHYHGFKDIESTDREKIGCGFSFQFSKLFTFYLNTLYFTDDYDRLVTHYGRYVDKHKQEVFFRTEIDPKESLRYFMNLQIRMFKLAAKFKQLKIDETEIVALSGLMLWKEAHCYFGDLRYVKLVEQIISELSWYEGTILGDKEYKVRVGTLCCILRDIELLAATFYDARFMGTVLNDYGVPKLADLERYK